MAIKSILKEYFNTGDVPLETEFASLIDSYPSFDDDFAPKYKKVSVSSAEILALNTTPKELVAAPGAGKVIFLQKYMFQYTFGTTAYATNTSSFLRINGYDIEVFFDLNEAGNVTVFETDIGFSIADVLTYFENHPLELFVSTGDPTAGDGTLDIHLWYSEVTL